MSFNWLVPLGIDMRFGDGQHPTTAFFERGESIWQGSLLHDNPRLYKYRWTIFTPVDTFERRSHLRLDAENFNDFVWDEFWGKACDTTLRKTPPELSLAAAMWRIRELHDEGVTMLIRNRRVRRIGAATPWNDHKVSIGAHAPAFEDDLDPTWHGFK